MISKFSRRTAGHRSASAGTGRLCTRPSSNETLQDFELKPKVLAKAEFPDAIASCCPASAIKEDSSAVQFSRRPAIVQMFLDCLSSIRLHCSMRPQTTGWFVRPCWIAQHAIFSRTWSSSDASPPWMIAQNLPAMSSRFFGTELTLTCRAGFTIAPWKAMKVAWPWGGKDARTHCWSLCVSSAKTSFKFPGLRQ